MVASLISTSSHASALRIIPGLEGERGRNARKIKGIKSRGHDLPHKHVGFWMPPRANELLMSAARW